jgi:hypothetical protein
MANYRRIQNPCFESLGFSTGHYRRNGIEVQGQDRRMLTERTLHNKSILKLVCIYSNKVFKDLGQYSPQ